MAQASGRSKLVAAPCVAEGTSRRHVRFVGGDMALGRLSGGPHRRAPSGKVLAVAAALCLSFLLLPAVLGPTAVGPRPARVKMDGRHNEPQPAVRYHGVAVTAAAPLPRQEAAEAVVGRGASVPPFVPDEGKFGGASAPTFDGPQSIPPRGQSHDEKGKKEAVLPGGEGPPGRLAALLGRVAVHDERPAVSTAPKETKEAAAVPTRPAVVLEQQALVLKAALHPAAPFNENSPPPQQVQVFDKDHPRPQVMLTRDFQLSNKHLPQEEANKANAKKKMREGGKKRREEEEVDEAERGHNFVDQSLRFGANDASRRAYRRRVIVAEIRHAFRGLRDCTSPRHKLLDDEVHPVSCLPQNWPGGPGGGPGPGLGLSLIDALDTLWLAGLDDELRTALAALRSSLPNFLLDQSVSVFEATIRLLGGLLSMYEIGTAQRHAVETPAVGPTTPVRGVSNAAAADVLSNAAPPKSADDGVVAAEEEEGGGFGDLRFLFDLALDLGNRLLPAFDTPSGIPDGMVHLRDGNHSHAEWHQTSFVLSEAGTLALEFRSLSYHSKNPVFAEKVAAVNSFLAEHCPSSGLCSLMYNTAKMTASTWEDERVSVGGLGDSYYEYLLKQFIHSGGNDLPNLARFLRAAESINERLVVGSTPASSLVSRPEGVVVKEGQPLPVGGQALPQEEWMVVTSLSGGTQVMEMDHLACFLGGLYTLGLGSIPFDSTEYNETLARKAEISTNLRKRMEEVALGVGHTCLAMYRSTPTHLAPEIAIFANGRRSFPVVHAANRGDGGSTPAGQPQPQPYLLRPEAVETFFYLHRHALGRQRSPRGASADGWNATFWEEAAWEVFLAIRAQCRVGHGYSGILDVYATPGGAESVGVPAYGVLRDDVQQSYFLAETMKYLLLIFTDDDHSRWLPLEGMEFAADRPRREGQARRWVLNTEGHPLIVNPDLLDRIVL